MQPKTRHNKMARANKKKVALADAATPIRDILALGFFVLGGSGGGGASSDLEYTHTLKKE